MLIGANMLRLLGLLTKDALFLSLVNDHVENDDGDDIPVGREVNTAELDDVPAIEQVRMPIPELAPRIRSLLDKHAPLVGPMPASGAKIEPMRIRLDPNETVVQLKARRLNPKRRKQVRAEVKRLHDAGITGPSKGPFASPVVVVDKSEDVIRLCVDYTVLNSYTLQDKFPCQS